MKRFLALTLAIIMVLSFAACGEEKRSSKKDNKEKVTTAETQAVTDNTEQPTETAPALTQPAPASGLTFGRLNGSSYESDYFGFGIEVPSSWTTKSASEIATLNSTDETTMQTDFESVASKVQTSYLFYTIDNSNGNNINIVIENLGLTNNKGMSGKKYLEAAEGLLKATYENMGAEDVEMEISTITIDKKTYDCMETVFSVEGIEMSQLVITIPTNDYIAVITITITDFDAFDFTFYDL